MLAHVEARAVETGAAEIALDTAEEAFHLIALYNRRGYCIVDHADWDDLCRTVIETGCSELWVTHGQEDALVHWAESTGIRARPLRLVGYEEDAPD